ncbi:MAG: S1 RNA-binding domain-containing protein, partial [Deltaproteobacteria bacterium]|nr:S1 RNA-binding domain-containing protein [Deltaproteobacteria bacterium]
VDLGGIEGMVHVSELGWSRVANPADVLSMGATVRVRILRIEDSVTKDGRPSKRIKLSMKAATSDPWLDAIAAFSIGSTYSGTVAKLEKFGAFVEIAPGVDGLVHISEMAVGRRIAHPSEVVAVGDRVQVQVVDVDPRKRQIALSMKALAEDPWAGVSAAFPVGSRIQGTVESIQSFGLFVTLPNGITGLIPMSQLAEGEDKSVHAKFAAGSAIEASVLAVEPERRRLTLTRRSDQDAESEAALKAYRSSKQGEPARLGTFADLLAGKTRG